MENGNPRFEQDMMWYENDGLENVDIMLKIISLQYFLVYNF